MSFCYLICSDASAYSHNANAYQKIHLVANVLKGNVLIPKGYRHWLPVDFQNHKLVVELQCPSFLPVLYCMAIKFAHKSNSALLLAVSNEVTLFYALVCAFFAKVVMFCWDPPGVARRDESAVVSRIRCWLMDVLMAIAVKRSYGLIMNLHPGFSDRFSDSVRRKIWHFPNGTDVQYNSECSAGALHVQYRVAISSTFSEGKGCWDIAHAFVKLWKRNQKVSIVWVGNGVHKDAIRKYFRDSGIPDTSVELGFYSHRVALEKLGSASIALCMYGDIPSLRWNYILKAPEFLSLGIPVIAPNLPGVAAYIKDGQNGFLYSQSGNNVVDILNDVLSDEKLLSSMKSVALKSVNSFDWAKVNADIAEVLVSMVQCE